MVTPLFEGHVHVIDDDDAVRDSLIFLFKAATLPVQAYNSAAAFLERLPQAEGGCIVTDVRMPGMSGIELLKRLRDMNVGIPVVVITGHGDIHLAVEAMKSGAVDFLEKPVDEDILLTVVRTAISKQAIDREDHAHVASVKRRLDSLSGRERQVLDAVISGRANKIIAYDLGISPRTVEIYRANVMTKMEASNLSELVRMALAAGVLQKADPGQMPKIATPPAAHQR